MIRHWLPLTCIAASLILIGRTTGAITMSRQSSSGSAAADTAPAGVINRYCVTCHNDRLKTAGLALNSLDPANAGDHGEVWEKVVQKLRARAMPPLNSPRPDERSYDSLVEYLELRLDRAAAAHPDSGRVQTLRRLNATEYQNAIRDLLALDVDATS